jgi:hypothetical protein
MARLLCFYCAFFGVLLLLLNIYFFSSVMLQVWTPQVHYESTENTTKQAGTKAAAIPQTIEVKREGAVNFYRRSEKIQFKDTKPWLLNN